MSNSYTDDKEKNLRERKGSLKKKSNLMYMITDQLFGLLSLSVERTNDVLLPISIY